MDSEEALPERLKNRLLEPDFRDRVKILGFLISLYGGTRNFAKVVAKSPDELLAAVLQESVRDGAQLARFFQSEDRALIVNRVLQSNDLCAWKELACSCPELADQIQSKILTFWEQERKSSSRLSTPYASCSFLEDFLRDTINTNPVPIQYCFAIEHELDRLVEMTARLPNRICLFATVAMIMLTGKTNSGRHLAQLCIKRPEALTIIHECLMELNPPTETFISVSAKVPGMDLDLLEEYILNHWPKSHQQMFCDTIQRDRGPARDMLAIEHVMES